LVLREIVGVTVAKHPAHNLNERMLVRPRRMKEQMIKSEVDILLRKLDVVLRI